MKKILLVMLLSSSFIWAMEEKHNKELKRSQAYSEKTISHATLMELYTLAAESSAPDKFLKKISKEVLAMLRNESPHKLPLEIILFIISFMDFSTPIEFLIFLNKLASINKHFQKVLKPKIIDLACTKFSLDKELIQEFLELAYNRSGIPCQYLEELLNNKERREKIKQLRILFASDPDKAINTLKDIFQLNIGVQNFLSKLLHPYDHDAKRDEAKDIIMSLPKKIFYFDLGLIELV